MSNDEKQLGCPEIRQFFLSELNPAPYNPRVISESALEGLANSIKRFGCIEPIIVNVRDNRNIIIGGHKRYEILLAAGDVTCLCVVVDLDESDEKLLNLTLNNPQIQGEFIAGIEGYIQQLRSELKEEDVIALRLNQIRGEILNTPNLSGPEKLNLSEDPAAVCFLFGEYRIMIDRPAYEAWKDNLRQTIGYQEETILAELKRRVGL